MIIKTFLGVPMKGNKFKLENNIVIRVKFFSYLFDINNYGKKMFILAQQDGEYWVILKTLII